MTTLPIPSDEQELRKIVARYAPNLAPGIVSDFAFTLTEWADARQKAAVEEAYEDGALNEANAVAERLMDIQICAESHEAIKHVLEERIAVHKDRFQRPTESVEGTTHDRLLC